MIPLPLVLAGIKGATPQRLILWGLLALAVGLLALSLFAWGHRAGAASVQASWDKEKLSTATTKGEALLQVLQAQQSLQLLIDQAGKDRQNEIARIDRLHAAAVDSLRNRPERPATAAGGVPAPAGLGAHAAGCTGADLYREDAAVALGIARDADTIVATLHECRARYQAAQQRLDSLATGQPQVTGQTVTLSDR